MAAKGENAPTIVIKKKKKGGHDAHHGGAWKVAYADFVTAMMAFFLLLWLLNATTEEQRNGIADYFSPTVASDSTSGGGGVLAGRTLSDEGALTNDRAPVGMNMRLPSASEEQSANPRELSEEELRARLKAKEDARFEQAAARLRQAVAAAPELKELAPHLLVDKTEEGLRIQLVDRDGRSMFALGSAEPLPRTEKMLALIAQAVAPLPNRVAVKGHTDATRFAGGDGYGNWELSSDRANASRRRLVDAGLTADRVTEVVGRADQDLLLPEQPEDPKNRRISIILLRQTPTLAGADSGPASRDARSGGPSILGRDQAG